VDDYDAPENSLLSDVLERRRGLPIALGTLALAMARRIEAPMAGVGMPGHFILADLRGPAPAYIDPFNGWAPLDVAGCARLVLSTTGMPFRPEYLRPVPERAILVRTLLNLRGSYTRRRRTADTLWTVELSLILAPGDPGLVRDGVVLLSAAGRYAEAEAAAAAFLADRPDDPAAPALGAQLDAVRHLRRRMN
jgi:regulator of sirC expression with transglutaminase-like and TPR domain